MRRIRITVGYEARAFNIEEAASLIYTHPRLLSLQEMYRVAAFYRPGTEQYREVYEIAAYHFPDDVLANINAASAVIMAGYRELPGISEQGMAQGLNGGVWWRKWEGLTESSR